MRERTINLKEGDKFKMLTILKEAEPFISKSGNQVRAFWVKCDCGNIRTMMLKAIVRKECKGVDVVLVNQSVRRTKGYM